MKKETLQSRSFLSNVKLFLALSRTTHGLLDLATPALSALLWLGAFPSPWIVTVGLLTAFSGYTAVYALNDLVDYRSDMERVRTGVIKDARDYLDTVFLRHPMAQGALSFRKGLVWAAFWALTALVGASLLGPVCALLFLGGVVLEATYCLMLKVSYLRVLVSGLVKTLGGIAAVFAVDPTPSPVFLLLLFLWLFFWEIGGQNLPADWHDIDEDSELGHKTIPVRCGSRVTSSLILMSLIIAVLLGMYMLSTATGQFSIFCAGGSLLFGLVLLAEPAYQACRSESMRDVDTLFAKASLYPLSLLAVLLAHMISWQIS
ncbi:MAG TPA: UbiA family prenyltransferase [Syntrophorhabdales bacterium]|nr:UbiA family prenyltransferase [Syntrophorhabdales bacterium]